MPADAPTDDGGALILAAGFSRRFGSDKRRHRLPDGSLLLIATLERYLESFAEVAVVLRDEDDDLAAEVTAACPSVRIVRTDEAQGGMGHSLAAGIRAVSPLWTWVAVALGDMPFIRADTLATLQSTFRRQRGQAIVQPLFGSRPGHPVLFPSGYFAELASLDGDAGARRVLARHRDAVLPVVVDDAGVLQDLDEPPAG